MANSMTGTLQGNVITLDAESPFRKERAKRRVQVTIEPLEDTASDDSDGTSGADDVALSRRRNARIDDLYVEVRQLMWPSQPDPAAPELVRERIEELQKLQRLEAEAMRKRFESRLSFPPGTGLAALESAQRLLGDDADPATPDASTVAAD